MARPFTASDEQILDAVGRAISQVGPLEMRLRDIGDEVGLAPPTLLQRFGSKRELLHAYALREAARTAAPFRRRKGARRPLEALERALLSGLESRPSVRSHAHHRAFMQLAILDPSVHAVAVSHARLRRKAIRRLLRRAVDAGDLAPGTKPKRLSRMVEAACEGALQTWTLQRRTSLRRWMRRHLRATLAPYRP